MKQKLAQWYMALVIAGIVLAGARAAEQPPTAGGAGSVSSANAEQQGSPARDQPSTGATGPIATTILGLCDSRGSRIDGALEAGGQAPTSRVGLNALLWVVVRTSADLADETLASTIACTWSTARAQAGTAAAQTAPGSMQLRRAIQLDASQYALFLDGQELQGVDSAQYDAARHALGFHLSRNDQNNAVWRTLLGSPTSSHLAVTVALGIRRKNTVTLPSIEGQNGSATFELQVFSWPWFWVAVAVVALVFAVVVGTARTSSTLRDTLLPQLPAKEQPFSLGRCQMAFWFVLIFASFIFLYALLWDYNTVSTQALALIGISSATALASVAVDVYKDSPADAANRALQALGLYTHADLVRMKSEAKTRKDQVPDAVEERDASRAAAVAAKQHADAIAADPAATSVAKADAIRAARDAGDLAEVADRELKTLQAEIQDRDNIARTYDAKVKPFRSESLWKDITTDLNGPTVHRLQVVFWTLALGGVFVVGVYRDLAMPPDFSATLLALMGLSGAGYVGFKYPEKNS